MIILWTKFSPAPINGATRFEDVADAAAFLQEVQNRKQQWDGNYYQVCNNLVVNAHDVGIIHLGRATWNLAEMPAAVRSVLAAMRGEA